MAGIASTSGGGGCGGSAGGRHSSAASGAWPLLLLGSATSVAVDADVEVAAAVEVESGAVTSVDVPGENRPAQPTAFHWAPVGQRGRRPSYCLPRLPGWFLALPLPWVWQAPRHPPR